MRMKKSEAETEKEGVADDRRRGDTGDRKAMQELPGSESDFIWFQGQTYGAGG